LENVGSLFFLHSLLAVLVLVDVSDHWTRNSLSLEVLKCLSQFPHIPSVLVLNKVGEELGFPTTDAGEIFPAPPEPEPTCWSCLGQIPDGCLSLTLGGSAKEEDHPAGTYK